MSEPSIGEFSRLAQVRVFSDPVDLLAYQRDCSVVKPGVAEAVVRPENSDAVIAIMRQAHAAGTPVYVRGGGTMYAGGANPHAGGIVLDVSGLNRILEIDTRRGLVVCEPGVHFGALAEALAPLGLTIGIMPVTSPAATVGGAASAHALGTGSTRFQSFADEVAGLEVVLADGQRLRTGSAASAQAGFFQRYCIGPDLTGLFLGADATFGVVTAVALWLHPLPEYRTTACYGFSTVGAGAQFMLALQNRDLLRNVWYGSGYEAATIRGRIAQARPELVAAGLPAFCVGLDYGGDREAVARDLRVIEGLCAEHGGTLFPEFDAVYFRKLRREETYWYSFAGYFVRSRCAILMASSATENLPAFLATVERMRGQWPDFIWGGAVVLCRRGVHAAVITFYDEATQWDAVFPAVYDCMQALIAIGCVPYKSGKIWAGEVRGFSAYHDVLRRLKTALDPQGILAPGNLGLDTPPR